MMFNPNFNSFMELENPTPSPLPPNGNALSPQDERTYAMLAHLSALAGFIIPFGNIIGPVVVWSIYKDKSSYVDFHGKQSINFQITISIAYIISFILIFVLIGILFLAVLGILSLVFTIIAGIKANNNESYKYPFSFTFIS
jgi:hypothetical protein